jgi:hypothetical protein
VIAPQKLWAAFKTAFCKALDETEKPKRVEAWRTVRNKTEFYEQTLMPAIKKLLSYDLQIERLRCDYTFLDGAGVPLIAVESENAHSTAWLEIEYLCSLAVPLKVLVLSCDWQAEKDKYLKEWTEIIRKHHAVVDVKCLYAVIVGEWDEPADAILEYTFTLLDTNGTLLEEAKHSVKS